jgi:Putative auto-transporter adhesin, head GIN domain
MKFNPNYLWLLLIPITLILIFQLVNIPFWLFNNFRSSYSNIAPGNTDSVSTKINVDNYDEINITGSMDVELIPGKEGEITVTAPSNILPNIKVESQNKALQIYNDSWKNIGFNIQFGNNNRTLVTVPIETLNRLTLTGSGKVASQGPIVSDRLIVNLRGSGDMAFGVDTKELEANTSGSGNIVILGKANNFNTQVFGSGRVDALELEAQNVKVSTSGSGDVRLWAVQSLEASTFGSGNISYKGNPVANSIKVSGSGEIKKIE